ncbi:unnamed protein product [Parnassius apollo]|uniref:(apollo) hypothetical protein n=1 Tax=Parnassius apollo TaxID=110799 RepID=A0A8S3XKU0_PARAO|nr:unnamed protein product [Parnassius apollo]
MHSNTFDVTELEWLRRKAVPSSDESAAAEEAAPQLAEQTANVDAVVNTPVVVDSNDDGTVAQELELEQMRSTLEEAIVETRSTPLENRPRIPFPHSPKQAESGCREGSEHNAVTYLEASRGLCEADLILFGAALEVCRIIGAKLSTAGRATGQSSAIPAWRIIIEERIAKARALIGRLICFSYFYEVVASQCAGITPMDPVIMMPDDVAEAVRMAPNWKSLGLDGLHHYWLKGFMSDGYLIIKLGFEL